MVVITAVLVVCVLLLVGLTQATLRPRMILYGLGFVVSFVGLNIHVGVTMYLSRVLVLLFILSCLVRLALGKRVPLPSRFLTTFMVLFGLILGLQILSVLLSAQLMDGLRQVSIYVGVMVIFVVVIVLADDKEAVVTTVRAYLVAGLVQGLYGVYQIIGKPFGLPTYQTLMGGLPTANDRTSDGYVYSGQYQTFRATGFFPADVSHYAGFMAGVLILAIAFAVYNRRAVFPYVVMVIASMGLMFSLSRSGILAFLVFGLPSLIFLLSRFRPVGKLVFRLIAVPSVLVALLIGVVGPMLLSSSKIELPDASKIVSSRLTDLLNPGANRNESMNEHLMTRLAGLDATADSPLIGVGLGVNASPWFSERYQRGWGGSHSHHLDILGQTGLLGAGLQFLFMGLVGAYMWRGLIAKRDRSLERHLLAGLLAAFIAILFGNFMYSYFLNDFVWLLMACGVALSRLLLLEARSEREASSAEPLDDWRATTPFLPDVTTATTNR